MIILDLLQGSPEWMEARRRYHTASQAPVMMGASPTMKRTELLDFKCGVEKNDSDFMQRIYRAGHTAEAAGRLAMETEHGVEFWPAVGVSDCGRFLASFDGITADGKLLFENKLLKDELVNQIEAGDLSPLYFWQLEHQLLVSGADKVLFVACDETATQLFNMFYQSRPERRDLLLRSWAQFDIDLKAHKPVTVPSAVKFQPEPLPAVKIQLAGAVVLVENLGPIESALRDYLGALPKAPASDEEFGQCDAAVKLLKKLEDSLKTAESEALSHASSIESMRMKVASITSMARASRLGLEKIVAAKKQQKIDELVAIVVDKYGEALDSANLRLDCNIFEMSSQDRSDFIGSIKGLKTPASMADALQVCLSSKLVALVPLVNQAVANLAKFDSLPQEYAGFFEKKKCLKMLTADLVAQIDNTIARHKEIAAKKLAAESAAKQLAATRQESAKRCDSIPADGNQPTTLSEMREIIANAKNFQSDGDLKWEGDFSVNFSRDWCSIIDSGNAAAVLTYVQEVLLAVRRQAESN